MPEPQRITLDPDPPLRGESVQICYEFTGSDVTATRLAVSFTPSSSEPATHQVTAEQSCVNVEVPTEAESIRVDDIDGTSPSRIAAVEG